MNTFEIGDVFTMEEIDGFISTFIVFYIKRINEEFEFDYPSTYYTTEFPNELVLFCIDGNAHGAAREEGWEWFSGNMKHVVKLT